MLALIGVAPTTQNAAEAEIQGFELEVSARPVAELTLDAGIGYVDAEYTTIGAQVVGLTRAASSPRSRSGPATRRSRTVSVSAAARR